MTDELIEALKKGLPADVLEKRSKQIVRFNEHVDELSKGNSPTLKGLATDMLKDFSKDVLKHAAMEEVEGEAWIEYFQKEVKARICHAAYDQANSVYWEIHKGYVTWLIARRELIKGYDPETGFKKVRSDPLDEGAAYSVRLDLHEPGGRRGRVWLGLREAGLDGNPDEHRFSFVAKDLKPAEKRGDDVVLRIDFQE